MLILSVRYKDVMLLRKVLLLLVVSSLFYRCIATTNCYTARTLKNGDRVMTPGFDFLACMDYDGNIQINKSTILIPSLGIAFGLPYHFEAGIRGYFPYTLESSLRWQVNPISFNLFDISCNLHFGTIQIDKCPYTKLGMTISKELFKFQPFVSYYQYNYKRFFFDEDDMYLSKDVVSFGIGIPFKNDLILPEINYMLKNDIIKKETAYFSIGIRAMLK